MYPFITLLFKTIPQPQPMRVMVHIEALAKRRDSAIRKRARVDNQTLDNLVAYQKELNWEMLRVKLNLITLQTGYSL